MGYFDAVMPITVPTLSQWALLDTGILASAYSATQKNPGGFRRLEAGRNFALDYLQVQTALLLPRYWANKQA